MPTIDMSSYRVPGMSAAEWLAVSRGLIVRVSKGDPEPVRKAVKRLHRDAMALQSAWIQADIAKKAEDPRPVDQDVDRAWSGLYWRLDGYAGLPEPQADDAGEAARIRESLFPQGMTWLTLPYPEQWAEGEKRLKRIADEKLEASLAKMCDARFLSAVRAAHARYGEVLGLTKPGQTQPPAGIGEAMNRLMRATNQYVRVVGGTVDDDDGDSVTAAIRWLQPIEDARARAASRQPRQGKEPGSAPASPAPVEPPEVPIPTPLND